jgi:hypothetical protein
MMTENDVIRTIVKWCVGAIHACDKATSNIGETVLYRIDINEWKSIIEQLLETGYSDITKFMGKHLTGFSIFNLSVMGSETDAALAIYKKKNRSYALQFSPIKTLTSNPIIEIWIYEDFK